MVFIRLSKILNVTHVLYMSNSNKFEPVWARASPEQVWTCLDRGIKQEFFRVAFSITRTTLKVGPIKTSATKTKIIDDDDNANDANNVNDANNDHDTNNIIIVVVGVSGVVGVVVIIGSIINQCC